VEASQHEYIRAADSEDEAVRDPKKDSASHVSMNDRERERVAHQSVDERL
jgi:hypothetical protein